LSPQRRNDLFPVHDALTQAISGLIPLSPQTTTSGRSKRPGLNCLYPDDELAALAVLSPAIWLRLLFRAADGQSASGFGLLRTKSCKSLMLRGGAGGFADTLRVGQTKRTGHALSPRTR
jgi:hypothetical protein